MLKRNNYRLALVPLLFSMAILACKSSTSVPSGSIDETIPPAAATMVPTPAPISIQAAPLPELTALPPISPGEHGNVVLIGSAQPLLSAPSNTRSLLWADVDMDDDLDLVVGNLGQANLIHLNNGRGQFEQNNLFGTGFDQTTSLASGDINGDGAVDLVVGNNGEQDQIYLNDGAGNFRLGGSVGPQNSQTTSLVLADIDYDGKPDLTASYEDGSVLIYMNRGQNHFGNPLTIRQGGEPVRCVFWGDINGDQHPDLLVGSYGGQDMVYLNNGQTSFDDRLPFGTGADFTSNLVVADIDQDGDLDLITAVEDGTGKASVNIRFYEDGLFGEAVQYGSDFNRSLAVADVDGDGDLDLLLGEARRAGSQALLNEGDGTFEQGRIFNTIFNANPAALAWGDIDGDGDLDLAIGDDGLANRLVINEQVSQQPRYGQAVLLQLIDEQGQDVGSIAPAYSGGWFQLFTVLKEGATYRLWLNSLLKNGSNQSSRDEYFESVDGVRWANRTATNLIRENLAYKRITGPRTILHTQSGYEAWEHYYYTWSSGWGYGVRYLTSMDGLNWTVEAEPALVGQYYVSVIRSDGYYHMWGRPYGDSNYRGNISLRYRFSEAGGTGWGNWETGGEVVRVNGEEIVGCSRVRQLPDGSYQLFYVYGTHLNIATSTDKVNFTLETAALFDLVDILPDYKRLWDFAVLDVDGEDWFYFTYQDQNKDGHIAVTWPVQ